jgi:hypothetical protein
MAFIGGIFAREEPLDMHSRAYLVRPFSSRENVYGTLALTTLFDVHVKVHREIISR